MKFRGTFSTLEVIDALGGNSNHRLERYMLRNTKTVDQHQARRFLIPVAIMRQYHSLSKAAFPSTFISSKHKQEWIQRQIKALGPKIHLEPVHAKKPVKLKKKSSAP